MKITFIVTVLAAVYTLSLHDALLINRKSVV